MGAIARESVAPMIVLPLGVEPDKPRLILDARYLNLWCPSEEMQYETLRHFQQGIDVDDWLFSLDHKSGYHYVPLTEDSWQLVGFQWEGAYYTFRVLPFGWAPACFVYNSLSAVLASFIRIHGLHCIFYLDDFGFSIPKSVRRQRRYACVAGVLDVMYLAGFTVAIPKSMLHPSHRLLLLGFGIDSHKQRFFVPKKKLEAILALSSSISSSHVLSRLVLQSFIGKVYSLSLAVPPVVPAAAASLGPCRPRPPRTPSATWTSPPRSRAWPTIAWPPTSTPCGAHDSQSDWCWMYRFAVPT